MLLDAIAVITIPMNFSSNLLHSIELILFSAAKAIDEPKVTFTLQPNTTVFNYKLCDFVAHLTTFCFVLFSGIGDLQFSSDAYICALASVLCQAFYLTFIQKTNIEEGLSTVAVLHLNSINCIPIMFVYVILTREIQQTTSFTGYKSAGFEVSNQISHHGWHVTWVPCWSSFKFKLEMNLLHLNIMHGRQGADEIEGGVEKTYKKKRDLNFFITKVGGLQNFGYKFNSCLGG